MTESTDESVHNLFHIGDTVQIIDLQTEKYNGKLAEVVGPYLIDTKRWPIQLYDDKDKLAIKPDNLKRVMPVSYKPSHSSGVYGTYSVSEEKKNEKKKITEEKKEEKKEETKEELLNFPVQAFVRMRPLVGLEIRDKHESLKYNVKKLKKKQTESLTLKNVYGRNNERDKKYTGFQGIILPKYDNIQTFNKSLLPTAVPYVFAGENVCIFAYGHTGSGKTHTIFGYKKEPGMYQLFARHLFSSVTQSANDIFIEVRFCELYQGKVYDLLSKDKRECFVREDINGVVHIRAEPVKCDDGKIRAYPIGNMHIQTEDELLNVISDGIASRNVGSSTLHDKSSRSHAFLELELVCTKLINGRKELVELEAELLAIEMIMDSVGARKLAEKKYTQRGQAIPAAKLKMIEMVEGLRNGRGYKELEKEKARFQKDQANVVDTLDKLCNDSNRPFIGGTVVFVDLAGNEYGRDVKNKDVQEERERNEINKSLLALKECIRGLHNNAGHIGYRNSKLTMYLKKYLSGKDSKAIMISNIGSSQSYAKQTINTLQYSQLVAKA